MFTVVIDESGDVGLEDVLEDPSHGPTQYFCMCATIFREDNRDLISEALEPLKNYKGAVHAAKMGHFEKVQACRVIASLPVGMLGVISNKLSLLEYLPEARKTPTHYYNKVAQYLFEKLGSLLGSLKITKESVFIRLEARDQQYSSLLSFIEKIQNSPLDHRALPMRNIDRFSISTVKKRDDLAMALSDIGAHALFCAVRRDAKNFALTETRYLRELSPIFMSGKDGMILPNGIKPIHSIKKLGLDTFSRRELANLKNPNKEYHRLT